MCNPILYIAVYMSPFIFIFFNMTYFSYLTFLIFYIKFLIANISELGGRLFFNPLSTSSYFNLSRSSFRYFLKNKKIKKTRSLNFTFRHIDGVLTITNPIFSDWVIPSIYPSELKNEETRDTASSV